METPIPVSAMLPAGIVNAGGFLRIRFADVMLLNLGVLTVLVMIGGFTALLGGLAMLAQSVAGPVAAPGMKTIISAFALALGIYAMMAATFNSDTRSAQALALGAILILGVACGSYAGDVNARLLASLLNDEVVHAGLAERGIRIPDCTVFIAALHDTTTDTISLLDGDTDCTDHAADVTQLQQWLSDAGSVTREERAHHLPQAGSEHDIARRVLDWAEVRPECALIGCQASIAAPRHRTSGRQLNGNVVGGCGVLEGNGWATRGHAGRTAVAVGA